MPEVRVYLQHKHKHKHKHKQVIASGTQGGLVLY
jgi:hypothetical protein